MKYDIEELKEEDLEESLRLIRRVFDEFEAPDYSEEGIKNFYKFIDYENVKNMLDKNMKMIVAKKDKKVIGVIGFINNSHISMLFVDKEYQRQEVGSTLVKYTNFYCTYNEPIEKITVNSAPCAVEFYRRLDFKCIDNEQVKDGIRFVPMELVSR